MAAEGKRVVIISFPLHIDVFPESFVLLITN